MELRDIVVNAKNSITPHIIFWQERTFRVLWVHPIYVIDKYSVLIDNNSKLQEIHIYDAFHPNAGDPEPDKVSIVPPPKSEMCLPEWTIGVTVYKHTLERIERFVLSQWWLDDPHHYPLEGLHFVTDPPIKKRYLVRGRS